MMHQREDNFGLVFHICNRGLCISFIHRGTADLVAVKTASSP